MFIVTQTIDYGCIILCIENGGGVRRVTMHSYNANIPPFWIANMEQPIASAWGRLTSSNKA